MNRTRSLSPWPARLAWLAPLVALVVALGAAIEAPAGPAGNLTRGVAGQGATQATGGAHQLRGTVGQALAGHAGSPTTVGIGFWYVVRGGGLVAVEPLPVPATFSFRLDQNAPNPARGTTHFAFALPREGPVVLTIYDVRGRSVVRLIDREMPAGEYRIAFEPRELASGSYFYELRAGGHVATKRLVVLH
jgi:hypothetical protein